MKTVERKFYISLRITLVALLFSFFLPFIVSAKTNGNYPKLANFYLNTPISVTQVEALAKWDVLILHAYATKNSPNIIKQIRAKNPKIIILAYVPSEEFPVSYYQDWDRGANNNYYARMLSGITPDMWLYDQNGKHVAVWRDNWMLNVSNYGTEGKRWNDYLSSFVANEVLSSGLWDGIFYDNVWSGIYWINNGQIDINRDGRNETKDQVDSAWASGMKTLFDLTRQKATKKIIIVGNGDRGFYGDINGFYLENFTDNNLPWSEKMRLYRLSARNNQIDKTMAIVGNTSLNTGNQADYQRMRFGLGSALMENGYYGYDGGSNSHAENWWYDEYEIDLGEPMGGTISQNNYADYKADVWQRNYSNGLAIVNSTEVEQTLELGGDYEKIHGTQDKTVNDGSIVSQVTVPEKDGLILLRTFASLNDVLFKNGSFLRFFRADGTRSRNGFFVFESGYNGGDKIAHLDLNNDGRRDLLLVSGNKISAWRDDGEVILRDYPYGASYLGEIKLVVGDIDNNGRLELLVAPSSGYPLPIKVYAFSGDQVGENWFPLGNKYKGGYSLAIRRDGKINKQLVVGSGVGNKPMVYIYDDKFKLLHQWMAFEATFKGGVNVTTGDIYGTGVDNIIVGAGAGKKPEVKIFDVKGKLLGKFIAYESLNNSGVEVLAADVDFDKKAEIITMSSGIGF